MATETGHDPREKASAIAIYEPDEAAAAQAHVLATGDLSKLSGKERLGFYLELCFRNGLESTQRPFDWLTLDGKLVLYPNANCANQLKRLHGVSVKITEQKIVGELFKVVAEGLAPSGRYDMATKYVALTYIDRQGVKHQLTGQKLGDAFMKAETGAKRRLIMSMIGLGGLPDVDEAKQVRYVVVDAQGNILENPTDEQKYLAQNPTAARAAGFPTYESEATPDDSPIRVASTVPTAEDVEWKRREPREEPASFRPDKEQVRRWLGAWFATVDGLSLDTDDARHQYVRDYTNGHYDSLEEFFEHCSRQQAGDFLQKVRAICKAERDELAAILAASDEDIDEVLDDVSSES